MFRYFLLLTLGWALPSVAQLAPPAAVTTVPFDVVAGVLVLRNLPFNGQRGDFVLDTGCTYGLVVEQTAIPKSQLRPGATQGLSAAGNTTFYQVPVKQFGLGSPRYRPTTAQATSLATIRGAVGPRLLGLIGTELLRHYEVVLDYAHRRLSLYPLEAPAARARPFTRRDSVAFTLEKGWPVAIGFIDSVPVQLLLDTGARDNLLDADFAQHLPAASRPVSLGRETLLAPTGQVAAQRARLPTLRVGTTEWRSLPVLLAPPVRYQSGRALPYQGILGGSFLSQEPLVSFHYGRRQLYILAPK